MAKVFETDARLSDAKFREIGKIIAHWSWLEFMVGEAIGEVGFIDKKIGRALTDRLSIYPMLDALQIVADVETMPRKDRDRMEGLIARIRNEYQHRNDVAHGLWGEWENRWYLVRFKSPKQIKLGKATRMTANELKRIANRVEKLALDFRSWKDSIE